MVYTQAEMNAASALLRGDSNASELAKHFAHTGRRWAGRSEGVEQLISMKLLDEVDEDRLTHEERERNSPTSLVVEPTPLLTSLVGR